MADDVDTEQELTVQIAAAVAMVMMNQPDNAENIFSLVVTCPTKGDDIAGKPSFCTNYADMRAVVSIIRHVADCIEQGAVGSDRRPMH